jgi:transposase
MAKQQQKSIREQIRSMTLAGVSQREISEKLNKPRGFVHRWQKRLGLTARRCGPRSPELSEGQKAEVLAFLKKGRGTSWIGEHLGIGEHQARLVKKSFGFQRRRGEVGYRYRLSDEKRSKIIAEIRSRQNFARNIAWKYRVAYKIVLALAHQELQCPRFRSGYGEPLSSAFPQKHFHR